MSKPFKYIYTKRITTSATVSAIVELPFTAEKLTICVVYNGKDHYITFGKTAAAGESIIVTKYTPVIIETAISSFNVLSSNSAGIIHIMAETNIDDHVRDKM